MRLAAAHRERVLAQRAAGLEALDERARRVKAEVEEAARERAAFAETADGEDDAKEVAYERYAPTHGAIGGGPHPDPVVETGTLAKVKPPRPTYEPAIGDLCDRGVLSALQMESIVYACMKHEQRLPGDRGDRAGFFLGDGAGVGKGRQIAGLVYEHRRRGGRRVLWVSTSADLKFDAVRDLDDLKAEPKIEVIPQGTAGVPKGDLADFMDQGVTFSTYSLLTQGSPAFGSKTPKTDENILRMVAPGSRLEQFVKWLKEDEHGPLIIFDECHKAKNLYNVTGTPTKTALCVVALQLAIPDARVMYCSATGASEPRNLAYMTRLGHFGWANTQDMLKKLESAGLGALEMFACGLKATGSYLCRTLSYEKAEFELVNCPLSDELKLMYDRSTAFWSMIKKVYAAAEKLRGRGSELWVDQNAKKNAAMGRLFWATHQRFFRQMLLCCKVPHLAELARRAVLQENLAVVIGLQSTGEASLNRASGEDEEGVEDFVSSPGEMLYNFIKSNFPTNSCRASAESQRLWDTVLADVVQVVNKWCSQETILEVLNRDAARAAAIGDDDSSDSEVIVEEEKSLDDVLKERLEAAKIAGNFLDLTEENIEIRARQGVNEAKVRELERLEEENALNEARRRKIRMDEERQLVLMHQRRITGALAGSNEQRENDENAAPAMRGLHFPVAGTPAGESAQQAGSKRPHDSIDFTLSDDEDDKDASYERSVQKRREEFEQRRVAFDGMPNEAGDLERGIARAHPAVPAPPPVVRDPPKPVVNALERLQRFAPAQAVRAQEQARKAVQVKAEAVPGRAPRAAAAQNHFYGENEENSESAEDDESTEPSDADEPAQNLGDMRPEDTVENRHLIHIRDLLLRAVDALQLPPNPLDNLIALCGGPNHVAEMTGRKLHQVRDEDGKIRTKKRKDDDVANAKMLNMTEKRKFQSGEKLIAIISDAASTGISLQADHRVENQRRRCHMTLELPWSADKAIQQFGRSHRSNQSSAPLYRILMTPCGGERRFASSAAKRLLSLGALLKGDRNALGAGEGLQAFDIDNQYGSKALKRMLQDMVDNTTPMPTVQFKEAALDAALKIIRDEFVNVGLGEYNEHDGRYSHSDKVANGLKTSQFLNRLLGMPVNAQKVVFDYFSQTLDGVIKEHKQNGTYDRGVVDMTGQSVVAKPEYNRVIHKCPMSEAETQLRLVSNDNGVSYRHVCEVKREYDETREQVFRGSRQRGISAFYIATYGTAARTSRPYVLYAREVKNFGEQTVHSIRNPQMLITRPNMLNSGKMNLEALCTNYQKVEATDIMGTLRARELWHFWYEFYSRMCAHGKNCKKHRPLRCTEGSRIDNTLLVCGAVLPVWSTINAKFMGIEINGEGKVREHHLQVVRAQTSLGEKFVGLKLGIPTDEGKFDNVVGLVMQDIEDRMKAGIPAQQGAGLNYAAYSSDDDYYMN